MEYQEKYEILQILWFLELGVWTPIVKPERTILSSSELESISILEEVSWFLRYSCWLPVMGYEAGVINSKAWAKSIKQRIKKNRIER